MFIWNYSRYLDKTVVLTICFWREFLAICQCDIPLLPSSTYLSASLLRIIHIKRDLIKTFDTCPFMQNHCPDSWPQIYLEWIISNMFCKRSLADASQLTLNFDRWTWWWSKCSISNVFNHQCLIWTHGLEIVLNNWTEFFLQLSNCHVISSSSLPMFKLYKTTLNSKVWSWFIRFIINISIQRSFVLIGSFQAISNSSIKFLLGSITPSVINHRHSRITHLHKNAFHCWMEL